MRPLKEWTDDEIRGIERLLKRISSGAPGPVTFEATELELDQLQAAAKIVDVYGMTRVVDEARTTARPLFKPSRNTKKRST